MTQRVLTDRGYELDAVSGEIDSTTRQALHHFQEKHHLLGDGALTAPLEWNTSDLIHDGQRGAVDAAVDRHRHHALSGVWSPALERHLLPAALGVKHNRDPPGPGH